MQDWVLLHWQGTRNFLKALKEKEYHICIETSGYTTHERITEAAKYTDLFLYDLKESDNDRHIKHTGVSQDKILNNLNILNAQGANVILRCPIIPGVNDRDAHFEKIAETANKYSCIRSVELMPYHPLGISKSDRIGEKYVYENVDFADIGLVEEYCKTIQKRTSKSVTVSG